MASMSPKVIEWHQTISLRSLKNDIRIAYFESISRNGYYLHIDLEASNICRIILYSSIFFFPPWLVNRRRFSTINSWSFTLGYILLQGISKNWCPFPQARSQREAYPTPEANSFYLLCAPKIFSPMKYNFGSGVELFIFVISIRKHTTAVRIVESKIAQDKKTHLFHGILPL